VTARGGDAVGVVAHSDHGSPYTSLVYGAYAKQSGIDLSMGSIGDPGTTHSPRASSPHSERRWLLSRSKAAAEA
jgi:transposase InsO family protein